MLGDFSKKEGYMAVSPVVDPILHVLVWLYQAGGNNLGFAIIAFTILLRAILVPLSLPALKSQKKMQKIKPYLSKLKAEFGHDKMLLQQKQMELYKEHDINPLSGCIPYLLQFGILIVLYNALNHVLHTPQVFGITIQTQFFGLNLVKPDPSYILPILSGVTQLVLSLMVLPGVEHHDIVSDESKNPAVQKVNAKETDVQEMAESVQKQMVFMMPVMTGFFALNFPSGLAMYWVVTTLFSIGQQYVVSGWGGVAYYFKKAVNFVTGKKAVVRIGATPVLEGGASKTSLSYLSDLAKALQKNEKREPVKVKKAGGGKKKIKKRTR